MPIPKIRDAIILKNGDFINGEVQNKSFSLKTTYGDIEIKRANVSIIHMKGIQFTKDEMLTTELNKFTGILKEKSIDVKLKNRQKIKIKKTKIHTINMMNNRISQ